MKKKKTGDENRGHSCSLSLHFWSTSRSPFSAFFIPFQSSESQESNGSNHVRFGAEMRKIWPSEDSCIKLSDNFARWISRCEFLMNKNMFHPKEENEELFDPEVPYLNVINALMYLANCTRPDIPFSVNLLARYSSASTKRHWNGIKHILRYLHGTSDMGLYYSKESKLQLIGYADAGCLSDPHKARSQT
ncbi:hypothetical protein AAG906_007796 [Vitis piasezkii]